MSSWYFVFIVATIFFGMFAWFLYKNYMETPIEKRRKLLYYYAGIALLSVIVFCGIRFSPIGDKFGSKIESVEKNSNENYFEDFIKQEIH